MFCSHVVAVRQRFRRFLPLLMLAMLWGLVVSDAKPILAADPVAKMLTPVTGAISTFPNITGTATDADGDLKMVKVLILHKVATTGNTDRIDFWNGTAWREAMTITDGDTPTSEEIQQVIATRILEVPFVNISGASANWSYPPASGQTVPSGANLTDGTYYVGAAALDAAFHYGIAIPNAGGYFVTLTKTTPVPTDRIPPRGTLAPPSGLYRRFPPVTGTASDNVGVSKVHVGILRRVPNSNPARYQYWNGSTFVTPDTQPTGMFNPAQIATFVTPYLGLLPRATLSSSTASGKKRWMYRRLPTGNGTYYVAVAIYDAAGNFTLLPGRPGYINTITVGSASLGGVTLRGRVTRGQTGLGNIPVFLLPGDSFSTVFMENGLDDIVRTTTSTSTIATATGNFVFAGVPPGNYIVMPAYPSNFFRPLLRTVSVATTDVSGINFSLRGPDRRAPSLTITQPTANSSHASLSAVTGTVRDLGSNISSGILQVGLALYSLPGPGAATQDGIYNWRTNSFETSVDLDAGLLKIVSVAGTTWSQTLPNLPPGNYRLWVLAADGAFNLGGSAPNTALIRDFTITVP